MKQLWLCLVYVKPADAPFESTLMSLHSLFNDFIIVKLFHQFLPALWSEFWSRKGTCRMIKAVIVSASIVSAWLLFNLKERHLGSSGSGFCKFLSTLLFSPNEQCKTSPFRFGLRCIFIDPKRCVSSEDLKHKIAYICLTDGAKIKIFSSNSAPLGWQRHANPG